MEDNDAFFVHVVESPASSDLLDGFTEGRALLEALRLSGVPALYNLVTDDETLKAALSVRLVQAQQDYKRFPILHFSLHGNTEGVALTNRTFLSWHDLRALLLPINSRLSGALIVCFSSCYGTWGKRMAMYEHEPIPFLAIVGHEGTLALRDATMGFASFYHLLRKGHKIEVSVDSMRVASGEHGFGFHLAEQVKNDYAAFLRQLGLNSWSE